ncbi:Internalin-A_(fragment) [Hexamita inflata]|uniref:Internalin-A n=1 Tax=Hexamita inflata TaxID=28002 RepID=A0AA86Q8T7_9EUKA
MSTESVYQLTQEDIQMQQYFKHLPRVKNNQLKIKNDKSLFDLSFMKQLQLEQVFLSRCPNISFRNKLSDTCQGLRAMKCNIKDLTGIDQNKSLQTLYIFSNLINDISPLRKLTRLSTLYASSNKITDLSPLSSLLSLKSLSLSQNNIKEIYQLRNLCNLEYLDVSQNQITDLNGIQHLRNLNYLDVNDNIISDLSPLSNCQKLEYLSVQNNQVTSIDPLLKLLSLRSLHPDDNFITGFDYIFQENQFNYIHIDFQQKPNQKQLNISKRMKTVFIFRTTSQKNWQQNIDVQKRLKVAKLEVTFLIKKLIDSQLVLSNFLLVAFGNHEQETQ